MPLFVLSVDPQGSVGLLPITRVGSDAIVMGLELLRQRMRVDAIPFPVAAAQLHERFAATNGQAQPTRDTVRVTGDRHQHVEPLLLTYAGAAARLGLGERTVRRLVEKGQMPVVRVGRATRIRTADIELFVNELETQQRESATQ